MACFCKWSSLKGVVFKNVIGCQGSGGQGSVGQRGVDSAGIGYGLWGTADERSWWLLVMVGVSQGGVYGCIDSVLYGFLDGDQGFFRPPCYGGKGGSQESGGLGGSWWADACGLVGGRFWCLIVVWCEWGLLGWSALATPYEFRTGRWLFVWLGWCNWYLGLVLVVLGRNWLKGWVGFDSLPMLEENGDWVVVANKDPS